MPHAEERYYSPSASYYTAPSSKQPTMYQPVAQLYNSAIPDDKLVFHNDPQGMIEFVQKIPSPRTLFALKHLSISFPSSNLSSQQISHVGMGIALLLKHAHNLRELIINWSQCPSDVFLGTQLQIDRFESNMLVDAGLIGWLESQTAMTALDLPAWGAHLPPSSSHRSYNHASYPPAPPLLSPTALPNLGCFAGHAEVASQLCAGHRPIKAVAFTTGFPCSQEEWRETMAGLRGATDGGVVSLSFCGIESNEVLPALAEVGRFMHDLDYLHIRVNAPSGAPGSTDLFKWDHWKSYSISLASIEAIDIEITPRCLLSMHLPHPFVPNYPAGIPTNTDVQYLYAPELPLPSMSHIKAWQSASPLLSSVDVAVLGEVTPRAQWYWKLSRWRERVSGLGL